MLESHHENTTLDPAPGFPSFPVILVSTFGWESQFPSPPDQPRALSFTPAQQPDAELSLRATSLFSLKGCTNNYQLFGYTWKWFDLLMCDCLRGAHVAGKSRQQQAYSLPYGCSIGGRTQFLNRNASKSHWTQRSAQEAKLLYTNHKLSVNTQNWSCSTLYITQTHTVLVNLQSSGSISWTAHLQLGIYWDLYSAYRHISQAEAGDASITHF